MHRGLTADERREHRRRQLIEAVLDVVAEEGVRNLRVRAISGRARLNDRYFYESFRDCQELLLATFDDQFARALAGVAATLAESPPDLRGRARSIVEFALAFFDEDSRRSRLLIELQTTEALSERRHEVIDVLTQIMAGLVTDGGGADDTVTLTALTVSSGLLELAAQWFRKQIDISRSQLVEFATALVVTTADITGVVERQIAPARDKPDRGDQE